MKLRYVDESKLGRLGRATASESVSQSGFGARREYFKKMRPDGSEKMDIATEHLVIGALIAWFAFK